MTTAGGGENIAIVIAAEDRASRKIKQVGDSLRKNLGTSIRSAALSMISFTAILSGVGLSITALIGVAKKFVGDIIKTNRAAAVLGLRFRQMGFDAERASSAVSNLRDNLSRGMVQSLRELSDEALALFESFSPESIKDIEKYVKILANAWKVDQKQALKDYMELQMGNTEALRQYGLAGLPVIEVNKELDRVQQDILDNQTPLEKMWIALKTAASAAMHEMLADVNDVFGDNGIVGIIRGALNLIGAGFGKARLGDRMVEEVTKMVNAVKKFDLGAIVEWAENLAKSIIGGIGSFLTASVDKVTGFVQTLIGLALNIGSWLKEKGQAVAGWIVDGLKWLSGTDAVGKLESWLKLAIALATTIGSWLKERGEAVAGSLLDGIKGLIGKGLNVARWISEALHLPDLFQRGVDLAQGLLNGLQRFLQEAIDFAIDRVNDLIDILNKVNPTTDIGRVGDVTVPNAPDLSRMRVFGGGAQGRNRRDGSGGSSTAPQPLIIQVNGREFARATMEVLDGQIRVRQPGVMIT